LRLHMIFHTHYTFVFIFVLDKLCRTEKLWYQDSTLTET
jgi:hypothetical protein